MFSGALPRLGEDRREVRVGFANSGGVVFVDESAEKVAAV